jgi:hypothetical protein
MTASTLNALFAAVVEMLPRLFLRGAPFLAMAMMLAALADTRLPSTADHTPTK